MTQILEKLIEMSLFGSVAIVAVIILRLLFSKIPRKVTVWFWLVAAVRLLCPVNFSSALSIFNFSKAETVKTVARKVPVIVNDGLNDHADMSRIMTREYLHDLASRPEVSAEKIQAVQTTATPEIDVNTILLGIWIAGIVILALMIIIRSVRIIRHLGIKGIKSSSDVYELDGISTSFVIGVLKQKICIPKNVSGFEREYILAHERIHIKNRDQLIKAVMLTILCIHWFNPFVWIMYRLLVNDIEMRCDEEVIDLFGDKIKKEYCVSLVMNASDGINHIAVLDSAFAKKTVGGLEIKMRIKNLLKYKKTSGIVAAVCLVLAIGTVWALSSNTSHDKAVTVNNVNTAATTKKPVSGKKSDAEIKTVPENTIISFRGSEISKTVTEDNNIIIYNRLPDKVENVVSLDSDTTRNILDIGAADKLLGFDTASAYIWDPDKDKVVFRSSQPIIDASPDIVFSVGSNLPEDYNDAIIQDLIESGICVVKIPPCVSLEYIKQDIRFIGELLDEKDGAEALVSSFEKDLSLIRSYCEKIKENDKRSVVFIRYANTFLNESSYGNFKEISELIAAKDLQVYEYEYNNSDEFRNTIKDINPDVIIFEDTGLYIGNDFISDKDFKDMKAVKNNAFGCVEFNKFRSTNTLDLLSSVYGTLSYVYPEIDEEMSLNESNS